ncbi:MAG: hypothetical protein ACREGE_00100 [Candidatus Microsaccharimonas sp.]
MSQLDQTRFKTVLNGIDVAREFQLTGEQRQVRGDSFTLLLLAEIPHGDEKPFPIIVDRRAENGPEDTFPLSNNGLIVRTTARLEPDGESFGIDIMIIEPRRMINEGAEVLVSKDMERLMLEQREREIDNFFADHPDVQQPGN